MVTVVIEAFRASPHARLEKAAAHRHSVPQETIHLLEKAFAVEAPAALRRSGSSYWGTRKLLPEFEAALRSGAFLGGTDSTQLVSDERDAR